MESFAHINVCLAAYGGMLLARSVPKVWVITQFRDVSGIFLELIVCTAALFCCGAALLALAGLAARAAHAARPLRLLIHVVYAVAMAVLLVCEIACVLWLALRGFFTVMLNAQTPEIVWIFIALLGLMLLLQVGALLLAALLARRATSPSKGRVTSSTAWKPM